LVCHLEYHFSLRQNAMMGKARVIGVRIGERSWRIEKGLPLAFAFFPFFLVLGTSSERPGAVKGARLFLRGGAYP
jgi:hypothetical protein